MENEFNLPFKVGQEAEGRSFEKGYRGAWFRCKILDITERDGEIGHVLDFYDFTDDEPELTQLYQVPPWAATEEHRELMLRPCYPPIYKASEMPQANAISQVSVIVDNSWKVGDLVDWRSEDCFWSGRISRLLGDGMAEIKLKKKPYGEGSVDEVELKDVRPSLNWSPQYGWTMPTQRGECGRPSAWLLKPIIQDAGKPQNTDICNSIQETESGHGKSVSSLSLSLSSSQVPFVSAVSDEVNSAEPAEIKTRSLPSTELKNIRKRNTPNPSSEQTPVEPKADVVDLDNLNSTCSVKKHIAGGESTLTCTRYDTLEATVMDLEEYIHKIKWLKTILGCGISSPDGITNGWEFVEPLADLEAPK